MIETRAYARAGFLGNPSDGYYGKTISISVKNFGAHITLYQSPELCIEPQRQDLHVYRDIYHMVESINLHGYYGGDRLIKASIKKFFEYCNQNSIKLDYKNFTVRYNSTIPRQVGLAGSSAIVTATLKALLKFYKVDIPVEILPSIILSVEIEELGINAGLQDRVIQVYEGCMYMDFDKQIMQAKNHGRYERIDQKLLPKLFIAYKTELSKVSGRVFNDVRSKFDRGDKKVTETLNQIADLAEKGRKTLQEGDIDKLESLVNENFNLRRSIMNISDENNKLISTARACGASAKFAGSGGSIIGIYQDDEMLNKLIIELKKIKARVIKPYII